MNFKNIIIKSLHAILYKGGPTSFSDLNISTYSHSFDRINKKTVFFQHSISFVIILPKNSFGIRFNNL